MGTGDVERLGSALTQMARELAETRREILMLKRENAALRSELEQGTQSARRVSPRATRQAARERHAA